MSAGFISSRYLKSDFPIFPPIHVLRCVSSNILPVRVVVVDFPIAAGYTNNWGRTQFEENVHFSIDLYMVISRYLYKF